jgi:hypothetical protein
MSAIEPDPANLVVALIDDDDTVLELEEFNLLRRSIGLPPSSSRIGSNQRSPTRFHSPEKSGASTAAAGVARGAIAAPRQSATDVTRTILTACSLGPNLCGDHSSSSATISHDLKTIPFAGARRLQVPMKLSHS